MQRKSFTRANMVCKSSVQRCFIRSL